MYTNTEIQIFHIALLTREEVGIVLQKRSTLDRYSYECSQFTADKKLDTVVWSDNLQRSGSFLASTLRANHQALLAGIRTA